MIENFKQLKVSRFSEREADVSFFLNNAYKIAKTQADVYVIAIGTDDRKDRKSGSHKVDSDEYIAYIEKAVDIIQQKNKTSRIVLIAPWCIKKNGLASNSTRSTATEQLQNYASSQGFLFIDPNPLLNKQLKAKKGRSSLKNGRYPDAFDGIQLYSWAVLEASPNKRFFSITGLKRILHSVGVTG